MKRGHYKTSKKGAERLTGYERYVAEVNKRVNLIKKHKYEWITNIRGALSKKEYETEVYKWQLLKQQGLVSSKVDITKEIVKEYTLPYSDKQELVLMRQLNDPQVVANILDILNELGDTNLTKQFNSLYKGDTLLLADIRSVLKTMDFIKKLYKAYKDKFGLKEAEMMTDYIYGS